MSLIDKIAELPMIRSRRVARDFLRECELAGISVIDRDELAHPRISDPIEYRVMTLCDTTTPPVRVKWPFGTPFDP